VRYRSGTSVRGKTRVSQHARKRLKSLFHLAAMSAIRAKGELQDYYRRKVAEGKNNGAARAADSSYLCRAGVKNMINFMPKPLHRP
jgi:hypothetical protein